MRKVLAIVVGLSAVTMAPGLASAQQSQETSGSGAVLATVAGVVVGGAIGYYYVTGAAATVVGAVIGGAIGNWWYSAGDNDYAGLPRKQAYIADGKPLFHPITLRSDDHPVIRSAAPVPSDKRM